MEMSKICGGLAALALAGMPESQGALTQFVYDDFSSGVLDTSKWEETQGSNLTTLLTDEHYVQDGVYHTAQITPADKGTRLLLKNHTFIPGESLNYDFNYISGEGNRTHMLSINGNYTSWSMTGDWGKGYDFKRYNITLKITPQGIKPTITSPDGEVLDHPDTYIGFSTNSIYELGVVTRTGHNGTVHMDYDNFVITTEIPEPSSYGIALGLAALSAGMLKRRKTLKK